jgi:transposase/IS5 family transposase
LAMFRDVYSDAGRPAYPPQMMLKLWFYAYSQGLTSSRRLEVRIREDLGYRFLAGSLKPDFWALNEFRKRHRKALNDVFTLVLEAARELGLGQIETVAVDSTRVQAEASPDRHDEPAKLRRERARLRQRVRRWQQRCERDNVDVEPAPKLVGQWRKRLDEIPKQLGELKKSGQKRGSRTDPASRYLKKRGGFCLGYTAEVAVSDDHLIVAQRVHQAPTDHGSLKTMVKAVRRECKQLPGQVLADSGYYRAEELEAVERLKVEVYVPDSTLARALGKKEPPPEMNQRQRKRNPGLAERRQKLCEPLGRAAMVRRKALVELVFGVLKQQRGMRRFRCRGLAAVSAEWTLAATAFNLTRMWTKRCQKAADDGPAGPKTRVNGVRRSGCRGRGR